MEKLRSKSCREGRRERMVMERNFNYSHINGVNNTTTATSKPPQGMMQRSYSANHHHTHENSMGGGNKTKLKKKEKQKSKSNGTTSWRSVSEAEMQRKKRVAAYKVYEVEGRVKGSIRKSFRWIKETCSNAVYGLW